MAFSRNHLDAKFKRFNKEFWYLRIQRSNKTSLRRWAFLDGKILPTECWSTSDKTLYHALLPIDFLLFSEYLGGISVFVTGPGIYPQRCGGSV